MEWICYSDLTSTLLQYIKTHPKLLRTQCLEKGENEREENIIRRAYLAATLTVHWAEQNRYSGKTIFFYFYTFNPLLPLIHGGARSYGAKQIPFIMFIIKQRFLSAFILESKEFITSVSYLQIYFLQQRIF